MHDTESAIANPPAFNDPVPGTSVAVPHPGSAAAWTQLLDRYEPAPADALRLRQAVSVLGPLGEPGRAGMGHHTGRHDQAKASAS